MINNCRCLWNGLQGKRQSQRHRSSFKKSFSHPQRRWNTDEHSQRNSVAETARHARTPEYRTITRHLPRQAIAKRTHAGHVPGFRARRPRPGFVPEQLREKRGAKHHTDTGNVKTNAQRSRFFAQSQNYPQGFEAAEFVGHE